MTAALILTGLMPRVVALPLAPHSGEGVSSRWAVKRVFPRFGDVRDTADYG
ncbi:hypothetical protein [Streptomyces sp. NPDC055287]